jgi:hypothetical protein
LESFSLCGPVGDTNADEAAPDFMDEGPHSLKIFLRTNKFNFRWEFSIQGFVSTSNIYAFAFVSLNFVSPLFVSFSLLAKLGFERSMERQRTE